MKALLSLSILFLVLASLSACIIRTGPRHNHRSQTVRSCPPAHHWDGYACVHNGRGRGRR
jgi:hypothetical protein